MVAQLVLAPSEVLLLNGEKFAAGAGRLFNPRVELPTTGARVSVAQLAQALLAVALLANEQAHTIRLSVRPKHTLIGLRTVDTLWVESTGIASKWPAASLELAIYLMCSRVSPYGEQHDLDQVFFCLLNCMMANPWYGVIDAVTDGLIARGLVRSVDTQDQIFKILTVKKARHMLLPAAQTLSAPPVEWLQELLASCQRERPKVWRLLFAHMSSAIRQCSRLYAAQSAAYW